MQGNMAKVSCAVIVCLSVLGQSVVAKPGYASGYDVDYYVSLMWGAWIELFFGFDSIRREKNNARKIVNWKIMFANGGIDVRFGRERSEVTINRAANGRPLQQLPTKSVAVNCALNLTIQINDFTVDCNVPLDVEQTRRANSLHFNNNNESECKLFGRKFNINPISRWICALTVMHEGKMQGMKTRSRKMCEAVQR